MEFCPKCGAVLMSKIKNSTCPRCNYTQKGTVNLTIKEKIDEGKDIAIIKKNIDTNPVVEQECPKCGHGKCYFWILQTRGADEAPTRFFKCVKCSHTKREYR